MASAKLANRTVNQSHAAISPANQLSAAELDPRSRTNRTVTKRLPISTTNMTGLRAMWRGLSLVKAAPEACLTSAASNSELRATPCSWCSCASFSVGGEVSVMVLSSP